MNKKDGNITMTLTLTISLIILIIITIYMVNMILPFVWYEKLENIANKYVYVVERYGYLTENEENELYKDLEEEGVDITNIELDTPKEYLNYGTLFKFQIKYVLYQNYSIINNGIKNEKRSVVLNITKYSYSKI